MYKCENCGKMFETPKVHAEWIGEKEHGGYQEFPICPHCKDDDIEELKDCPMCQQNYMTSEKDRCYTCEKTTALWLEEAIGNIQSDTGAERSEVIRAVGGLDREIIT